MEIVYCKRRHLLWFVRCGLGVKRRCSTVNKRYGGETENGKKKRQFKNDSVRIGSIYKYRVACVARHGRHIRAYQTKSQAQGDRNGLHIQCGISQPQKNGVAPVAILICSFDNLYFISFANQLASLFEKKSEFYCSFLCSSEINVEVIKQCVLQRIDLLVTHSCVDDETMEFAKINDIRIVVVGEKTFAPTSTALP